MKLMLLAQLSARKNQQALFVLHKRFKVELFYYLTLLCGYIRQTSEINVLRMSVVGVTTKMFASSNIFDHFLVLEIFRSKCGGVQDCEAAGVDCVQW
jgi:hypothetical protein